MRQPQRHKTRAYRECVARGPQACIPIEGPTVQQTLNIFYDYANCIKKKLPSDDFHLHKALNQNTAISDIRLIRENDGAIVDKANKLCGFLTLLFTLYKRRERFCNLF